MILYRPTGLKELALVAASGWRAWPPRLADQPFFYPVLSLDYARKIARDWNARDEFSGFVGFVTRFEITAAAAQRYPVQRAGGASHEELWIPAAELDAFNQQIVAPITVIEAHPGPRFTGRLDPLTHLPDELAS